jgi:hypothetical protein
MGEFKAPAKLTRIHVHRVVVDGEVREVTSNLTLADLAEYGRDLSWLERLAREYGRPVLDGAA